MTAPVHLQSSATAPSAAPAPLAEMSDRALDGARFRARDALPGVTRLIGRAFDAPLASWVTFAVVAACVAFTTSQLAPMWLVRDTTPTGGDMGAHVWGPAYLRDHLIPAGRLTGWTPDWYGGFPAYTFYMVIPSLLILLLDVVLPYGIAFKLVAVSGVVTLPIACWAFGRLSRLPFPIAPALAVGGTAFLFDMGFSIYGGNIASTLAGEFAFSMSLSLSLVYLGLVIGGLETGRHRGWAALVLALTGLCHLIPAIFAAAVTLVIALIYIGISWAEAHDERGGRPERVGLIALGVLAALVAADVRPDVVDLPPAFWAVALAAAAVAGGVVVGGRDGAVDDAQVTGADPSLPSAAAGAIDVVDAGIDDPAASGAPPDEGDEATPAERHVAVTGTVSRLRPRVWWGLTVMPVGALLAAWWVAPFYGLSAYLNDMGWEKLQPWDDPSNPTAFDIRDALFFREHLPGDSLQNVPGIHAMLVGAAFGLLASLLFRRRAGVVLGVTAALAALAFAWLPEGRLWNARLLPFYYLSLDMLAAIGLAEIGRSVAVALARDPRKPVRSIMLATPVAVALGVLVFLGLTLRVLPGGRTDVAGVYGWGPLHWSGARHFAPSWARWNFTGYEEKPAYPEYQAMVAMMDRVGEERGCGMSMWEYSGDLLGRYGTPMSPMLLPFWTDGCIGSMEGLYFEASTTTPFHFLNQDQLSEKPSNAQRDLPYSPGAPTSEVFALGVSHLQQYGVRYYLATTSHMVELADAHPALLRIDASAPWTLYEVAESAMVAPLANEPAVVTGIDDHIGTWLPYAVSWYQDADAWDVLLAQGGASGWQRVAAPPALDEELRPIGAPLPEVERRPVPEVEVTNIEVHQDSISFDVSEPGVPVVVRSSYFPSWDATGADGPWRVMPNLMVVLPTDTHVELRFGRSPIELGATAASAVGLLLLVVLFRRPGTAVVPPPYRPVDGDGDDDDDEGHEGDEALEVVGAPMRGDSSSAEVIAERWPAPAPAERTDLPEVER